MPKALTTIQKNRLRILEPKLDKAIMNADYQAAREIVHDIQSLLRPTEHFVRLCRSKNRLFELAIEKGDYNSATKGLLSNSRVLNKNTRIYIETLSLLAICFIRMQDFHNAKPYIRTVLKNETVIRSENQRRLFRASLIDRLSEEMVLSSMRGATGSTLDESVIEQEIISIIQTKSEEEIFEQIGEATSKATKELLFMVYDFSTKQLATSEKFLLPSPQQKMEDTKVGITVFHAFKRVIYRSLCDPDSEIYKVWYNNGMRVVLSKGYIKMAIISSLVNIGISAIMIVASVVALVMKLGIEVYCERYRPLGLMEIRDQKVV